MNPGDSNPKDNDALSPELYAALLQARTPVTLDPGWLVVLGHNQESPDPKRLQAFADTFSIDAWTASQWLRSPAPRVLRRVASQEKAQKWMEYLHALRIGAFMLAESEMARRIPRRALMLERLPHGWIFANEAGDALVRAEEILCVVAGEVREDVYTDRVEKMGFMGELSRGHERSASKSRFLIDIHTRIPGEFHRLDQDELGLSLVYPHREQASSVLIRELLAEIRETHPAIPFFTDFGRAQDSLGNSARLLERTGGIVNRWLHGAAGSRVEETRATLVSTAPAFQLYSVLLAEETRQLGTA